MSIRGKSAIVGIGETRYYRHGASPDPEFKLGLEAILAAVALIERDGRTWHEELA